MHGYKVTAECQQCGKIHTIRYTNLRFQKEAQAQIDAAALDCAREDEREIAEREAEHASIYGTGRY